MSIRCPHCGTPVPAAKVFWFTRMLSFACLSCGAGLVLDRNARTIFLAAIAASIVISYAVMTSLESDLPAIIVFLCGLVAACVFTWKTGKVRVADDPDQA